MKQTVITATGFYTIAGQAGNVIEAAESGENGAAIQLGVYDKKPNQEWKFIREGEGVYRIQNRGTGKMLDLVMTGTVNGTWLHQWEDLNASSQMWIVENTADGKIKLLSQLANGKCIDTVDMNSNAGARLQIWDDVNGDNQLWTLTKVTARRTAKKAEAEGEAEAEAEVKKTTRKTTKKAEGETAAKKTTTRKTAKKAEGEAEVKKTTRRTTKKAAEKAE